MRITTKFILWFLVIALVPLAIATYISYTNSQRVLKEEIAKNLLSRADNKINQIETYFREKETNINTLSQISELSVALEKFKQTHNIEESEVPQSSIEEEFRPLFTYYAKTFGYDDLLLVSKEGEVVFSVKVRKDKRSLYEIALYRDSALAKAFINAAKSLKIERSDFEYYPEDLKTSFFIAAPLIKEGFVGAVVAEINSEGFNKLITDYTGLGTTGETIVALKKGNEAIVIGPLRFEAQAAFQRKITIGLSELLDVQAAVQGKDGFGIYTDYRNREVLSAHKYLKAFGWGLVVKMDTSEVLSSANRLRNDLLRASLVLLVAVVLAAILIARSVSRPIKELTKVSRVIAGGNLSARAGIETKDEIGELANSFNRMTDSLVEAKAYAEKKRLEVEEQKELLEKANQELDSFVYTVSHDLRAPLRGVASFAYFLEEDSGNKLDSQGKDHLNEIRKGISRMEKLIEDLLNLSRISRIKNPYEDVNMNVLLDSVIERIKVDIKEHRVNLHIQENIPSVYCDKIKVAEVFLNLITNAIKFSSKNNKENPKVEVGYSDENDYHKFYVRDNGIGIDPKYHNQVFGIFKRLHSDKEYSGTGVGLSIVKRVIDDHGGKIWIESELGKGAIFYLTIPKGLKK